jgi:MFS family permease
LAAEQAAASPTSFRATGPAYIATIAIGHGLKHWYIAAFAVFLPLIEEEYQLTTFGVAMITTIRQFAGGSPNFFVGYVSDKLRNYWHLLLPVSFLTAAASMMLAGLMPWYWPMVFFIAMGGVAAAFWHPPAISMLSTRFPERRGMAIAFHGSGSGAGEALAPLIVGLILAFILMDDWRLYVMLAMIPAVGLAVLIWWMLIGAGPPPAPAHADPPKLTDVFTMLRYPMYRSLAYMNFTRSIAHFGVLSFLPIYLARDLGMDSAGVGFHIALLTLGGVVVGPLFGHYSDRVGRRLPMVASLVVITIGMTTIGIVGDGPIMVAALAIVGIFLWSVQDVTNATAMDSAPPGKEGSVVGMMFSSSLVAGVVTPSIMGIAIWLFDDRRVIFFVAAAFALPAILVMSIAPLTRDKEEARA